MRIKITDIISRTPQCVISCRTEFGDAILIWKGELPEAGKRYDVEFDSDEKLTWGDNILLTEIKEPGIYMSNNKVVIEGTLESVDNDGTMTVRIGDYILTFETQGEPYQNGVKIRMEVHFLEAYPFCYS